MRSTSSSANRPRSASIASRVRPGEELHHQVGLAAGQPPDPIDRDDVRMAQQAQRPCLAHEAVDVVRRGQELGVHDLDRERPPVRIARTVHGPAAPRPRSSSMT